MDLLEDLTPALMPTFRDVAREAGALAMRFFQPGLKTSAQIWSKSGGSPGHRSRHGGRCIPEGATRPAPAGGGLAFGGDGRRRPAARQAPGLDRRSDRRHARLRVGRPRLVGARPHSWPMAVPLMGIVYAPGSRGVLRGDSRTAGPAGRRTDRNRARGGDSPDAQVTGPKPLVDGSNAASVPSSACPGSLPRAPPRPRRRRLHRRRPGLPPMPTTGTSPRRTSSCARPAAV